MQHATMRRYKGPRGPGGPGGGASPPRTPPKTGGLRPPDPPDGAGMVPKCPPDDSGMIPGRFRDHPKNVKKLQKLTNMLQHFLTKWTSYESSGHIHRLKSMAYGSSLHDLFSKNSDLTCIFQSTSRFLRKTLFFIWSHLRCAYE